MRKADLGTSLETAAKAQGDYRLYNGIRRPSPWPPQLKTIPSRPSTPYYIASPPTIIPIDVGRQLFVDDFLIADTTLERRFHSAQYHSSNPVLKVDRTWESLGSWPAAMPFHGGIFFDPRDRLFKLWYDGGFAHSLCLATSRDGVSWSKPSFDVKDGTNIVHLYDQTVHECQGTVWLDHQANDPSRRFNMIVTTLNNNAYGIRIYHSADGIHWHFGDVDISEEFADGNSFYLNPFLSKWVLSSRGSHWSWHKQKVRVDRYRRYVEADTVAAMAQGLTNAVVWAGADSADPKLAAANPKNDILPGLYSLQAVAYESCLIGGFSIIPGYLDGIKANFISLAFSRDGFTWDRPNREPFLAPSGTPGAWNTGYLHSANGVCLIVDDLLYFYVGSRQRVDNAEGIDDPRTYNTGLATLRRDGFSSMNAGSFEGSLTTRPVVFSGERLFVNVAAASGRLQVEALTEQNEVISRFTKEACAVISVDSTRHAVTWKEAPDLTSLAGQAVRFRFHLMNGSLYSFWVSPDASGASRGYVAGGGPGFSGNMDGPAVAQGL